MAKGGKPHTEPNGLKRLEEALADASKRGPFSKYLRREFEEFSRAISKGGPRWDVIAEWAKREGHTGGEPIKPATAKRAYEREKKRREKLAAAAAEKQPVTNLKPESRERSPVRILPPESPVDEPPSSPSPVTEKRLSEFRRTMIPEWEKKKDDRR